MTAPNTRWFVGIITLALCNISGLSFADSYEITDSFGKHRLQKPPERVVVTDWTLLEQLLELDITPVGAPELDRYRRYVVQPALSKDMVDIGLRRSPDLQILQSLEPDAIIIGTDQKALARALSRTAPVFYYNNFSKKYRDNGEKARARFLQLADLFRRKALAQTKLAAMDKDIKSLRQKLDQHFVGGLPKVTLIRFSKAKKAFDEQKILVYGHNSIPMHVIEKLGMTSNVGTGHSKWGHEEWPVSRLKDITKDIILYIEPLDTSEDFLLSEEWLSIPAVQQGRIHPMPPAWSYGGAMSLLYNARAIYRVLMERPNLSSAQSPR